MGIIKKLSPIPRKYSSDFHSLESSLATNGYFQFPGTAKTLLPTKGIHGRYNTGLDEQAPYIKRMNKEDQALEIQRIREDKVRLEDLTHLDLSPTSSYYNYSSELPDDRKVSPVKMGTQDKFFNMDDAFQEITWNWVKLHFMVAPSLQAVERGEVHPDIVKYYVVDDEVESRITYSRKQSLNKAIAENDKLTPTKRKRLARLMGLPVTENTKEEVVYNLIDSALKDGEFTSGEHKGTNSVSLFSELFSMKEDRLKIKDYVDQAIGSNIYRIRANGRIYEGENEMASSKTELVDYLLLDKNQEELFALEKKLSLNKLAEL